MRHAMLHIGQRAGDNVASMTHTKQTPDKLPGVAIMYMKSLPYGADIYSIAAIRG